MGSEADPVRAPINHPSYKLQTQDIYFKKQPNKKDTMAQKTAEQFSFETKEGEAQIGKSNPKTTLNFVELN